MKIGVIGLGKMGGPIAAKLVDAGHDLTVWNRSPAQARDLEARGAKFVNSPADAMHGDLLLSLLYDDDAIRDVLLSGDGLPNAAEGCAHACLSTVSAAFAEELERFHAAHGFRYAATPMLGRPEAIAQSGLNFLAGGERATLDLIEPVLSAVGRFWHVGDRPHQAHVAKLAANFMISGAIEAMAEAAATLRGLGADPDIFFSVMTETLFGANAYKLYAPMIAGRKPDHPSGMDLVYKDNGNFVAAAERASAQVPLARAVRANLKAGIDAGAAREDWSTVLAAAARGEYA
jgi:3-hydroxyisobutyrate dehydrogenase-like beta-hydroxyacid dehydrogenase